MAVPENIITASDIDAALSQELVTRFRQDYDRLAELMGIIGVERRAAGTALYQLTASGSLNNSASANEVVTTYAKTTDEALVSGKTYYTRSGSGTTASPYVYTAVGTTALNVSNIGTYYERTDTLVNLSSSSGTGYVEGDEVALSHYTVSKTPVGDISPIPYRKMTTAKAILQDGYEGAVLKTDAKMLAQVRSQVITSFFSYLANGTATPTGTIAGLQEALALTDAKVQDNMETNDDNTDAPMVHFVNRTDIAAYLANATISTQNIFGMTYIQNFLGVENIFVTNKVSSGTLYATSAANLHAYGIDFDALSRGGLAYEVEDSGLIGVAHTGAYDHASAETNVMCGLLLFAENLAYIGKTTFTPDA